MQETLRRITDSSTFQNFITGVILLAAVLVGLETYQHIRDRFSSLLYVVDALVLAIFTLEILVKMGAEGSRPWRYFRDSWNVFDFVIVAACFLPFHGNAVTVLRLLRLLRVLKLVRALPELQVLVSALLRSIPRMFYVSLLLSLLFYIYAVAGVFVFSENDPVHFENLQTSMLSLFRIVTLEDWTDVMYINMYGCENYGYDANSVRPCAFSAASPSGMSAVLGAAFFVSFVLMGTMIVLNLFIGVIMTGMDEARTEAEEERKILRREMTGDRILLDDELGKLRDDLASMQKHIGTLERVARDIAPAESQSARTPSVAGNS